MAKEYYEPPRRPGKRKTKEEILEEFAEYSEKQLAENDRKWAVAEGRVCEKCGSTIPRDISSITYQTEKRGTYVVNEYLVFYLNCPECKHKKEIYYQGYSLLDSILDKMFGERYSGYQKALIEGQRYDHNKNEWYHV